MDEEHGVLLMIPAEEIAPRGRRERAGVKFREPMEFELFPRHVEECIPEGHVARTMKVAVEEMDLGQLKRTYSHKGGYPYDPRLLLATVLFGMTDGVREATELQEHCLYDARYRFLMGGHTPDDRTFGRFLDRVEPFLSDLLGQILGKAKVKGKVKTNEVIIDGSKVPCSASSWNYSKESEQAPSDPDARMMNSHGRYLVGYNAQIAIDSSSGVIVGADVSCDANDWHAGVDLMLCVKEQLGELPCSVIADSGYETSGTIQAIGEMGVDTVINSRADLRAELSLNSEFELVCPAGKPIVGTNSGSGRGMPYFRFRPKGGCRGCPLAAQCAFKDKSTWLLRQDDPAAKYLNKARVESEAYRGAMLRRRAVERPFASLKRHDKFGRFLRRGLSKVRAEFLLWVISYDIRKLARAPERVLHLILSLSKRPIPTWHESSRRQEVNPRLLNAA